jgi:hypothetical protein
MGGCVAHERCHGEIGGVLEVEICIEDSVNCLSKVGA